MKQSIDHATLHRTAKYFMDSGRATSHEAAMALLEGFGLTIHVGDDLAHSVHQQTALLTLINAARRTFLGGIEIVGFHDCLSITPLAPRERLAQAVQELGGTVTHRRRKAWPAALIGDVVTDDVGAPCWRLTWEGWRGGVTPARACQRTRGKSCDGIGSGSRSGGLRFRSILVPRGRSSYGRSPRGWPLALEAGRQLASRGGERA